MAYLYDRSKNRIIEKLNISLRNLSLSLSLCNLLPFLSSLPHLLTILVFINRYPDGVSSYLSIKHQYNVRVCVYIIHVSTCITCTVYAQSVGLTLFQICGAYQVVLSVLVSYTGTVPVDASMGGCGGSGCG